MRTSTRRRRETFRGDPVEQIRNRIHISPFWEEDLDELADIVGVDRVLFGSDYPHPEGLAEPRRYIDVLNERTSYRGRIRPRSWAATSPA